MGRLERSRFRRLSPEEIESIAETLRADYGSLSVPIASDKLDLFYCGFYNDTIWPLFHYFPTYTEYTHETWEAYRAINRRFFEYLEPELEDSARVWVHDYQLMLLPWRDEILTGLLGSDLIGFHTYDHARHFLSSVRRLNGYDHSMGVVQTEKRAVKVDVFPIVSPSGESVGQYMEFKREIDELVSGLNGRFSTLDWIPIHYQYQTAGFDELSALYRRADALLVTPLRDGMNLIAKEYLAARNNDLGALILSETAGAARELSEPFPVNPSDIDAIAEAIHAVLTQSEAEQSRAIGALRQRIRRHTGQFWASSFLEKLDGMVEVQATYRAHPLGSEQRGEVLSIWRNAQRKLLILDYDGTLVRFFKSPGDAVPDEPLLALLGTLARSEGVQIVLSSGRDRANLQEWFGHFSFGLRGRARRLAARTRW